MNSFSNPGSRTSAWAVLGDDTDDVGRVRVRDSRIDLERDAHIGAARLSSCAVTSSAKRLVALAPQHAPPIAPTSTGNSCPTRRTPDSRRAPRRTTRGWSRSTPPPAACRRDRRRAAQRALARQTPTRVGPPLRSPAARPSSTPRHRSPCRIARHACLPSTELTAPRPLRRTPSRRPAESRDPRPLGVRANRTERNDPLQNRTAWTQVRISLERRWVEDLGSEASSSNTVSLYAQGPALYELYRSPEGVFQISSKGKTCPRRLLLALPAPYLSTQLLQCRHAPECLQQLLGTARWSKPGAMLG